MPRTTDRRAMLGCFPTAARRPKSPPPGVLTYEDGSTSTTSAGTGSPPSSASTSSSPAFLDDADDADAQADAGGLSTAIASRRLFLAPPGRSNSIVDSAPCHGRPAPPSQRVDGAAVASAGNNAFRADGEAVRSVTLSTDAPRAEFLKSMVEMAGALGLNPRRGADRARMHDLLLWYVAVNDSGALRDILAAFTELLCLLNGNNSDATVDADGTGITPPATATADRATHR